MPTTIDSVQAELTADSSGFKRGVDQARDVLGRFTSEADKLSQALQSFGFGPKLAANFLALNEALGSVAASAKAITSSLVDFGRGAVTSASDFEQTGSLIERVFADGAAGVEDFARVTSSELGLSLQETREGLVSIGAQLKNSLGDTTAARSQSEAIIKLAADISAAQNIPFAETLQRVQSGLRGETEAIEKLNVFIGDAALKQEALRLGFAKSTAQMTEQEKTTLRLSAIFRQTKDLVGAAAAESESFSGRASTLNAELKNLGREIGDVLLPVATSLVGVARDLVSGFRGLSDGSKKAVVTVGALAAGLGAIVFSLATVAQGVASVVLVLTQLGVTAAGVKAALLGLTVALGKLTVLAATFTATYAATREILDLVGYRSVPQNVSVFGELKDAFVQATSSGKGLQRTLLNVASTVLAVGAAAVFVSTAGLVDLRDEVDSLNEHFQSMIDESEGFDRVAQQLDELAVSADLREVADGSTGAIDELRESLVATDAPLADTAEAAEFLNEKQREGERAAKAHAKAINEQARAIDEQAKAFERLTEFAKKLQDEVAALDFRTEAIGAALVERENRIQEAERLGAAVSGVGAEAALAGVANEIDRLFLRSLGDAIAQADDFVAAMAEAEEILGALGLTLTDVVRESDALAATADRTGVFTDGFADAIENATETVDEFVSAVDDQARELRNALIVGALQAATGNVSGASAAVGGAIGAAVGVAAGEPTGALGGTIGALLGTIFGDLLQDIVDDLSVVSPLFDGVAVALEALEPAVVALRPLFRALGQLFVAASPLVEIFAVNLAELIVVVSRIVQVVVLVATVFLSLAAAIAQVTTLLRTQFIAATFWVDAFVYNLQRLVNSLIDLINGVIENIRKVPGFEQFGVELQHVDVGGFGVELDAASSGLDDVAQCAAAACDGTEALGEETSEAAENMRELNEEVRNAASDFKVAAYRFEAQSVVGGGGTIAGGSELFGLPSGGQLIQFIMESALIQADDPLDLAQKLQDQTRRGNIRRRGTNTGRNDGGYGGRWEG